MMAVVTVCTSPLGLAQAMTRCLITEVLRTGTVDIRLLIHTTVKSRSKPLSRQTVSTISPEQVGEVTAGCHRHVHRVQFCPELRSGVPPLDGCRRKIRASRTRLAETANSRPLPAPTSSVEPHPRAAGPRATSAIFSRGLFPDYLIHEIIGSAVDVRDACWGGYP